jgi:hypothetical protein
MQCSQFNLGLQRRSSLFDHDKTTPALESVLAHKILKLCAVMGDLQAPALWQPAMTSALGSGLHDLFL